MTSGAGRRLALVVGMSLLAACAQHPRRTPVLDEGSAWSGRLSLRVDSDPPQRLSSAFELEGDAQRGRLLLTTPLGSALAELLWSPQQAVLRSAGQSRHFDSMAELLREALGTELPLHSLFDWLRGRDTETPGWSLDARQRADGRLVLRRSAPEPRVELVLLLD